MKTAKRFAAAALAAAALAALPASASAFEGFAAGSYPATLTGTGNAGFVLAGAYTPCSSVTFGATLKKSSNVTTSSPSVSGCAHGGVEFKGCGLELDPRTESVAIGPPGCEPTLVRLTECLETPMYVPAQTGIHATYTNVGSGSKAKVEVYVEDTDITYSLTKSNPCAKVGTYHNGALSIHTEISAKDAGKNAVGLAAGAGGGNGEIGISLQGPGGVYEQQLGAAEYPAQVSGEAAPGGDITLLEDPASGQEITCEGIEGEELSGASYEFGLSDFSGCSSNVGYSVEDVRMNGCNYVFSGIKHVGGEDYESGAEIACPEGKEIKIETPLCPIQIPAQKLSSPASFSNTLVEPGNELFSDWTEIDGDTTASSVTYSYIEDGLCFLVGLEPGTYHNGKVDVAMRLFGREP